MKSAILVPGRPDKEEYYDPSEPTNSNNHWFPWLSKQLMQKDIFTVALEIPTPWQPRYEIWQREFERFDCTPDTVLVGHSCGGGFLIRYISEHKDRQFGRVVLVAPWINPDDNPVSDTADFFHFEIDPDFVSRTKGTTVFISDNDHESVLESVKIVQDKIINIEIKRFADKGHFCKEDMHTVEFPELLEALI